MMMTTLKNYSMVLAVLLCLMHSSWAFELSLCQTEDVKHPNGIVGEVNWQHGISIEGLVSEQTHRISLRKGTALLARDSQYLYLGIISDLPGVPEAKLKSSDNVFFNVTSPTGKNAVFELNSNGEGSLSGGVLQTFKLEKAKYHHIIAIPWLYFDISSPVADSIWEIQMGRLFQSPNERALLNLKTPVRVRMDDSAPAFDFKVGKSSALSSRIHVLWMSSPKRKSVLLNVFQGKCPIMDTGSFWWPMAHRMLK